MLGKLFLCCGDPSQHYNLFFRKLHLYFLLIPPLESGLWQHKS